MTPREELLAVAVSEMPKGTKHAAYSVMKKAREWASPLHGDVEALVAIIREAEQAFAAQKGASLWMR